MGGIPGVEESPSMGRSHITGGIPGVKGKPSMGRSRYLFTTDQLVIWYTVRAIYSKGK